MLQTGHTPLLTLSQDAVIAYALYNFPASNDQSQDNHATSNRQSISEHMTESQIEEGQALTRRMKSEGVLKTIDHIPSHNLNHTHKKKPSLCLHENHKMICGQHVPPKPQDKPHAIPVVSMEVSGEPMMTVDMSI